MNLFQLANDVRTHLLAQGVRSYSYAGDFTGCMYRGPNSTSCAVGFLIPDALYSKAIENLTASALIGCTVNEDGSSNYNAAAWYDSLFDYQNFTKQFIAVLEEKYGALEAGQRDTLNNVLSHLQHIHDNVNADEWEPSLDHYIESIGHLQRNAA